MSVNNRLGPRPFLPPIVTVGTRNIPCVSQGGYFDIYTRSIRQCKPFADTPLDLSCAEYHYHTDPTVHAPSLITARSCAMPTIVKHSAESSVSVVSVVAFAGYRKNGWDTRCTLHIVLLRRRVRHYRPTKPESILGTQYCNIAPNNLMACYVPSVAK